MTISSHPLKLSLSLIFAVLLYNTGHGQSVIKDSIRTDTVIIQKPPLELVKKVYIPYQSKQSGKFFVQVGVSYLLKNITDIEFSIDSTQFHLHEKQQQILPSAEVGYYSRLLRYRIGFSFGKQRVEKYSETNSSQRFVDYFTANDTIERYYKKRKNGEIEWFYVIRQRPDSSVTVENYKKKRAAIQEFNVIQIPAAVSVPLNFNWIILQPEIGLVFMRIKSLRKGGVDSPFFDHKLRQNLIFFDPFVSFSAGLELMKNLYFHSRLDYRYNLKPAGYYPRMTHGNTSVSFLVSYLF